MAAAPPPAAAEDAQPQALLEQGRLLRREGKEAEAVPVLEQALALKENDFDIEAELGRAYSEMGQNAKAARLMGHALAQRPRDYDLTVQLAKCYLRMGQLDRARKAFGRAKKIDPQASQAYIEQGYAHLYAGEFGAARREFESLIAVDRSSPLGYHHVGSYLGYRGDYAEAEGYFRRAVQRLETQPRPNPDDLAHALECVGKMCLALRKYPEAEAAFHQGLAVRGALPFWKAVFLAYLCRLSAEQSRIAKAERYGRRALALCESDANRCNQWQRTDVALAVGHCYVAQGRKPEAQALARRIRDAMRDAQVNSDNVAQVNDLANLFQELGAAGEAEVPWHWIVAARAALPNHQSLGQALAGLAGIRLAQGRLAEARDLYLQAIEIHGLQKNANEMASALNGLAEVYDKEGRPDEAKAARRRAEEFKAHSGGS